MSVPFKADILTFRTNADMSAEQWTLVKRNGDNDMDVCGAGELPFGALTDDVVDATAASGSEAFLPVQVGGFVKVKCAGAITAGTLAMSDANGEAVAVTDGNYAFGQAIETHADDDVGLFVWGPSYFENT